jgi:hypothetical protein
LNKQNLEGEFENYANRYTGWGSYGDQFKFIADNPENDKRDDEADAVLNAKHGFQIVTDRKMAKFGWFF